VLTPLGDLSAEEGLREGLSELGYVEGKNLTIEWRRYAQSSDAMRSAAADLVRSRVDLIVAIGTQAGRAALSETSTVPIVFVSGDPVGTGLAASLAHPGANATGLSSQTTELMAKRLQLLQQIAPRTRRVIMLVNPDSPLHAAVLEEAQKAARTLRMDIAPLKASNPAELDAALRTIQHRAGTALIISSDVFFIANRDKIAEAVRKARLPTLVPNKDYRGEGVLMAYGSGLRELDHRAAVYIDKILKGNKPANLPIEQGSVRLVIDLRAARNLGLKVPQELLYRADEVIR
jgi:putative ABC transport system substrate-binding protein